VADDQRVTLIQDPGDRFAIDAGTLALRGAPDQPAMRHDVTGGVVHGTAPGHPLVHMVCWDEEPCQVELSGQVELGGRVALTGDDQAPVVVRMRHEFTTDHHQTLAVEPLDHAVHVETAAASPIHHALQLRTPLEVRFCNPWHVASDYRVEINLGQSRVIGIRLTGATIATPQPCADECPPPKTGRTTP